MWRAYAQNLGSYTFWEDWYLPLTASAAITAIDALDPVTLTGVVEFSVENRTAALVKLVFSELGGPVYVYPGQTKEFPSGGKYTGTMSFVWEAWTNVGAAVAGVSPYIQVITKVR